MDEHVARHSPGNLLHNRFYPDLCRIFSRVTIFLELDQNPRRGERLLVRVVVAVQVHRIEFIQGNKPIIQQLTIQPID